MPVIRYHIGEILTQGLPYLIETDLLLCRRRIFAFSPKRGWGKKYTACPINGLDLNGDSRLIFYASSEGKF
jgi:hypothetical protein